MKLKLISLIIAFFACLLIPVFFLSSCGFIGGGGRGFIDLDSQLEADSGEGGVPRLSSRIQSTPDLADQDCEGNNRCEEACENIYDSTESSNQCTQLNIGQVADIEDVFYILLSADSDEYQDIKKGALEEYLEIGLDGWLDKIIPAQREADNRDEKFRNSLHLMVDQENIMVPILKEVDQDNEILKEIFLGYCNPKNGLCADDTKDRVNRQSTDNCLLNVILDSSCDPANCVIDSKEGNPGFSEILSVPPELLFVPKRAVLDASGNLYHCYTDPPLNFSGANIGIDLVKSERILSIDTVEKRHLFMALGFGGSDFFERAAESERQRTFVLGHNLIEQVCADRDNDAVRKCINVFYCWLQDQQRFFVPGENYYLSEIVENGNLFINNAFFGRVEEQIGRVIDLRSCDGNNF